MKNLIALRLRAGHGTWRRRLHCSFSTDDHTPARTCYDARSRRDLFSSPTE